jgi:hypothetical protein
VDLQEGQGSLMTTLATRTATTPAVIEGRLVETAPPVPCPPMPPPEFGTAIAAGQRTYLVAHNPWKPWATRAGLVAIGSCAATIVTIALASPLVWWALASTIATALLFAFLLAGHELTENRPTSFKKAP